MVIKAPDHPDPDSLEMLNPDSMYQDPQQCLEL
jgi:hypothetical protein